MPKLTKRPSFKSLRFGKTSAEKESIEWPDLLKQGYFDPHGLIRAAKQRGPFLFLGYKGSGKSAIGEHLRLTAAEDSQSFVRYVSIGDFPYTPFSKLIKGDIEPEAKYPTAWSWLMLLLLFDQFAGDYGSSLHVDSSVRGAYELLKEAGLLPSGTLKHIVQVTSKRSFGLKYSFFESAAEQATARGPVSDIPFLVEKLKEFVLRVRSESTHLLVIDGLDEVLTKREKQYDSIAGLIYESDRLNNEFARAGCPAKIIILCRTDLYEQLPSANKNKIRQDSAIHLDWYHDPHQPGVSNLIRLVNHRASVSAQTSVDIFRDYLPANIKGPRGGTKEMTRFLLELTRHTPRDFITLLNYIQKYADQSDTVSPSTILSAVRAYSVDYFVPEIKDELHGYLTAGEIDGLIALFSGMGKREFSFNDLARCADEFQPRLSVEPANALRLLFECSAVGTLEEIEGKTFFTVKYRNRNAVLDLGKKLILHRGMWKALNLN